MQKEYIEKHNSVLLYTKRKSIELDITILRRLRYERTNNAEGNFA